MPGRFNHIWKSVVETFSVHILRLSWRLKVSTTDGLYPVHSLSVQGTLAILLAIFTLSLKAADRPNVLFIAIDDLRPELGCYGVKEIHSPNIDRLASTGVRFDRAYCQLAVCNPSRVSVLTGLRPDSTKVWTLDVRFRHTIPNALTMPQHFKKNGYHTVGFGKIFHNPWPDNVSWSEPHSWPKKSRLWSAKAKLDLRDYKARMAAEGKPQKAIDRLRAAATEIVDIPDSEHIDGAIAEQAIKAMRRASKLEEPFFLAAGFVRPHLPFVVPRKYWELYDREAIPLESTATLPIGAPDYAMNTMYELRDYMDFLGTPDPKTGSLTVAQQRELKHGYYASVSLIDAQVGRLMDELQALGLAGNTIVVLWSDHGWKLGEHNSWCKQTNYEIDARVPLIIHDPRSEAKGTATQSLVELVDLFPTLCDLTGLPTPKNLEGTSLTPILKDPETEFKQAAISQFPRRIKDRELMGYSMRTDRWRYIEWIDRKTKKTVAHELYDHQTDHAESANVADNPAHKPLLESLGKQLRSTLPKPLAPKPPRPSLSFHNQGSDTLTIYWLPEKGVSKQVGTLKPGRTLKQNTTGGHRFLIEGPGFKKVYSVSKANQTISVGKADPPNIVVIMGDDWSWPHASILGDPVVKTPNFDRIAREGVLFENAFVSAPSCTPSRHSVSSGQYHWRSGVGVNLGDSISSSIPVYPDLLAAYGWQTGFCRKGTAPSKHKYRGNDPFGPRYKNFGEFFDERKKAGRFCFWYGAGEPHRPYDWQAGKETEMDLAAIKVPPYLPDSDTTRTDLGDYYLKVQKLDKFAGEILDRLEKANQLENTIVVMSGDNGMPFPRAKATLYDSGTRVPLAIRWGKRVKGGREIADFVSLTDLAPTFLEACSQPIPKEMTGRSLLPALLSDKAGQIDPSGDHVLTGMEQHVYPYPSRAIRTADYLYIRNFAPESWPTGIIEGKQPVYDFRKTPWPTEPGAFSHNIDPGPTKQWMLHNEYLFERRSAEELYNVKDDPDQLNNLVAGRDYPEGIIAKRKQLSDRLTKELRASGDPRFAKSGHATFDVRGWSIHLSDKLWADHGDITRRMLELLDGQLKRVVDAVPKKALAQIREVPIWINPPYEGRRGSAEYHPGAGWLKENGRDPAMVKAIEITNVKNFPFENRRMPYVLLHELSHGYHHRILEKGYSNPEIKAAYEHARDSGTYDNVARFNGIKTITDKAYGMSSPMEYFAESSEAYFGKNDFFPFNREELKSHDPEMHDLVKHLWGAGDQ